MKQIRSFITEVPEEFKVDIVEVKYLMFLHNFHKAVRLLIDKFPLKSESILIYLSHMLRDDSGERYKASLLTTLIEMMDKVTLILTSIYRYQVSTS